MAHSVALNFIVATEAVNTRNNLYFVRLTVVVCRS